MGLHQWLVYARFDPGDKRWRATVDDREVAGSMQDVVLALNAANYRIISVVASTTDVPLPTSDAPSRADSYVKAYAIFVDIEH